MQQATTAQPSAPAQSTTPTPTFRLGPVRADQADALLIRISDIRGQLQDLSQRREQLFAQRQSMSAANGASHDARIAAIDQRSAALEKELFATQDLYAQAKAGRVVGQTPSPGGSLLEPRGVTRGDVRDATRQAVFSTIFGVFALYMVYRGARRLFGRRRPPPGIPDYSSQMAQLQQSIDVIALEVERISEGQRYVSKMLGAGAAQPVAAPEREHAGARASR